MPWNDSMVTRWRLIKRPWAKRKIANTNIDKRNERTKGEATKININNFSSTIYILSFAHETPWVSTLTADKSIQLPSMFLSSVSIRFGLTKQ